MKTQPLRLSLAAGGRDVVTELGFGCHGVLGLRGRAFSSCISLVILSTRLGREWTVSSILDRVDHWAAIR
jgi:hypothetical protein